jgi:hypothetical protein
VLVPMSTRGDEVLDRSLAAIGGKGLFLKELELAMQRGEADCAVHSLKDVPMVLEPGFALPAILARADHADAFVSNRFDELDALPQGAVVGTSSLRRQAQLRARRPISSCATCAATSTRAWRNSMRASTTRSCWRARACAARIRIAHPHAARCAGMVARARAGRDRDRMPRRHTGNPRLVRGARRCSDARMRGSRARDEPRAARQLPRAGGGVRATRRRRNCICRAWWVRRTTGAWCAPPDEGTDPEALGIAVAERLLAQGARALIDRRSVVQRHHVLGLGEEQPALDERAGERATARRDVPRAAVRARPREQQQQDRQRPNSTIARKRSARECLRATTKPISFVR